MVIFRVLNADSVRTRMFAGHLPSTGQEGEESRTVSFGVKYNQTHKFWA
jgi:hypothetical protein